MSHFRSTSLMHTVMKLSIKAQDVIVYPAWVTTFDLIITVHATVPYGVAWQDRKNNSALTPVSSGPCRLSLGNMLVYFKVNLKYITTFIILFFLYPIYWLSYARKQTRRGRNMDEKNQMLVKDKCNNAWKCILWLKVYWKIAQSYFVQLSKNKIIMAASDWYAYQDLLLDNAILSFMLRDVKSCMFYASTPHNLVFKLNATSQDAVRLSVMFGCTDAGERRVAALWDTEIKSIVCNLF